jgi:hypothetical protein
MQWRPHGAVGVAPFWEGWRPVDCGPGINQKGWRRHLQNRQAQCPQRGRLPHRQGYIHQALGWASCTHFAMATPFSGGD